MRMAKLLEQAQALGATLTAPAPGKLHVAAPEPLPDELMAALREHKPAIIEFIQHQTELIDLPWPVGYGGLPADQVAMAEATNDRLGVTDHVNRRLNVLMWMWSHYRDEGDVEMARQMRGGYHELRHADPGVLDDCGLCEYAYL